VNIKKASQIKWAFWTLFAFTWFFSGYVIAQPLEDINLLTDTDKVIATIRLSGTVNNVRHFPAKKGALLEILLDILPDGSAYEEWIDNEVRKSPPSSLIPSFTVKTNLKKIQPKLIITFSREAAYTVSKGTDGRSIVVSIKIDQAVPGPEIELPYLPEVKPLSSRESILPSSPDIASRKSDADTNKQAYELMQFGRKNLAGFYNLTAIDTFNKLLLLPHNDYTQDAQEWVGVARERAGQLDKAKLEYELYLKLYKRGAGAERVKNRLSKLGTKPSQPSVLLERPRARSQEKQTQAFGSLSMNYYNGASKVDTVSTFGNTLNQSTFSALDQSALITSVDATERFISEEFDNRIVFRDTAYSNFLPGQTSKNRLNSAYLDIKNKLSDYSARLGRQNSSGKGVLGRFDGATVGFSATPSIRINAVAGQLSDYTIGSKPVFYGASMDMGPVTFYAINQTIDDLLDRKAIGTEIHYFQPTQTAFALLDYDTSYSTINTAMFQGTLSSSSERTYNLLLDHRKSPYISTRNALYGSTTISLADLLLIMSETELRTLAAARTGSTNLVQLGVSQQISEKWQVGGDIRTSNFEGLPASGTTTVEGIIPETPSSGNEWATSFQLSGNNLYSSRDVSVFNLSYIISPTYKGQSFYVYSHGMLTEKWSMDASLQLYRQETDLGTTMSRIMPSLRSSYQMRQQLSFEVEAGIELSHSESSLESSETKRQFFSLGFRWDF